MAKRLMVLAALLVLALSADAVVTRAQHHDGGRTVIRPASFTIPAGQCPQLPKNLVVTGTGVERLTIKMDSGDEGDADDDDIGDGDPGDGAKFSRLSKIAGMATDSLGGRYTFVYENRFKTPIPGSGIMTDSFRLTGKGAANGLFAAFKARVTVDSTFDFDTFNVLDFQIIRHVGDSEHCDPL
jgi:hypothetical protein